MLSPISLAILATLAWGISKLTTKIALNFMTDRAALVWHYLAASTLLLILTPTIGELVIPSTKSLYLLAITLPIGIIAIYSLFKGLKLGKNTLLLPIAHGSVIITIVLSMIFFGDRLSVLQAMGIVAIIGGVIGITLKRNADVVEFQSIKYALVTMVGWGLWFVLIKFIVDDVGAVPATLYLEGGITIGVVLLFRSFRGSWKGIIWSAIAGVFTATGSFLYNLAISANGVNSIIATISQGAILIAIVGSFFFLGERITRNQTVAIGVILVGILIVSL